MFFDRPDAGKKALLLQIVLTDGEHRQADPDASLQELEELAGGLGRYAHRD